MKFVSFIGQKQRISQFQTRMCVIKILIVECNNFTNNIYCNHVTDEYSIIKFSWMRLLQHAH